jgi:hypothetical protein
MDKYSATRWRNVESIFEQVDQDLLCPLPIEYQFNVSVNVCCDAKFHFIFASLSVKEVVNWLDYVAKDKTLLVAHLKVRVLEKKLVHFALHVAEAHVSGVPDD